MIELFLERLNEIFLLEQGLRPLPDGNIQVDDIEEIPDKKLNQAIRALNKKGFGFRSTDELLSFIQKVSDKNDGIIDKERWEDHVEVLSKVFGEKKPRTPQQEMFYLAARYFGLTNDLKFAGYIMPSGKMLDFSGRKQGHVYARSRELDHREIGAALENLSYDHPAKRGGTDGMKAFMREGPIRIGFSGGSIHIEKEPTPQQYSVIQKFIQQSDDIYLDLGGKGETESMHLDEREKRKIINIIKRYYS